jgi:hypothetical protein
MAPESYWHHSIRKLYSNARNGERRKRTLYLKMMAGLTNVTDGETEGIIERIG